MNKELINDCANECTKGIFDFTTNRFDKDIDNKEHLQEYLAFTVRDAVTKALYDKEYIESLTKEIKEKGNDYIGLSLSHRLHSRIIDDVNECIDKNLSNISNPNIRKVGFVVEFEECSGTVLITPTYNKQPLEVIVKEEYSQDDIPDTATALLMAMAADSHIINLGGMFRKRYSRCKNANSDNTLLGGEISVYPAINLPSED